MINVFKVKKISAILLSGFLTTILFYIGLIYYGFLGASIFMGIGMILCYLVGTILLKNPFQEMLEGKGILTFNMDSTGIIYPFIVRVQSPFIKGKIGKNNITDIFDREAVYQMAPPKTVKNGAKFTEDGRLEINIDEKELNRSRFALFHYPVLIYNQALRSLITKDWFSEQEKQAFTEHGILYLNRKAEELTTAVRDFARHVVDTLKPKSGGLLANKWVIIIVIILAVLLVIMFAPAVFQAIAGTGGNVGGAVANIAQNTQVIGK